MTTIVRIDFHALLKIALQPRFIGLGLHVVLDELRAEFLEIVLNGKPIVAIDGKLSKHVRNLNSVIDNRLLERYQGWFLLSACSDASLDFFYSSIRFLSSYSSSWISCCFLSFILLAESSIMQKIVEAKTITPIVMMRLVREETTSTTL